MRAVFVLAVIVLGAQARAQPALEPAPPTEAAKARAKVLYTEGTKQYDLRDYEAAIESFRKAYDLLPEPLFLFDIGQAYRQRHDCENARSFYKSYLRNLPAADNRAKVERFIADMDDCVRQKDNDREAERRRLQQAKDQMPPITVVSPPPQYRRLFVAGIITAAAGVAVAGGGVYFSIDAANQARHIEQLCVSDCEAANVSAVDQQGKSSDRNAIGLYAIGGAALATGVGMIVWATLHADPESVTVTPTPGGVTVSTTVRF